SLNFRVADSHYFLLIAASAASVGTGALAAGVALVLPEFLAAASVFTSSFLYFRNLRIELMPSVPPLMMMPVTIASRVACWRGTTGGGTPGGGTAGGATLSNELIT